MYILESPSSPLCHVVLILVVDVTQTKRDFEHLIQLLSCAINSLKIISKKCHDFNIYDGWDEFVLKPLVFYYYHYVAGVGWFFMVGEQTCTCTFHSTCSQTQYIFIIHKEDNLLVSQDPLLFFLMLTRHHCALYSPSLSSLDNMKSVYIKSLEAFILPTYWYIFSLFSRKWKSEEREKKKRWEEKMRHN